MLYHTLIGLVLLASSATAQDTSSSATECATYTASSVATVTTITAIQTPSLPGTATPCPGSTCTCALAANRTRACCP